MKENRQSFYTKESGSYYYKNYLGDIQFRSNFVSIIYDTSGLLMKHGLPDLIQKHFIKYKQLQAVAPKLFNFKIVSSDKWKVSELNRILDTTGYVKRFETHPESFLEEEMLGVDAEKYLEDLCPE